MLMSEWSTHNSEFENSAHSFSLELAYLPSNMIRALYFSMPSRISPLSSYSNSLGFPLLVVITFWDVCLDHIARRVFNCRELGVDKRGSVVLTQISHQPTSRQELATLHQDKVANVFFRRLLGVLTSLSRKKAIFSSQGLYICLVLQGN